MKIRPRRKSYPYMCPYCDELTYPSKSRPPLILHNRSITLWVCPNNHEFFTYERVCTHQDWAYKVFNGIEQRWRKDSDKWLKELIKKGFGVEDYNDAMSNYDE